MSLFYQPLTMEDDGRVYLDPPDGHGRPELLGHIEDGCDFPEFEREWAWLSQEWEDGRRFAVGCRAAAEVAYLGALGDPCSRALFY